MFSVILYSVAVLWLALSFYKDRRKAEAALKKAGKSLANLLPSMLTILLLIGLILTVLDEKTISKVIGSESGVAGMMVAAVIGCITLIPGYVAFPLAASLIEAGGGYGQIALFISTLMMVGIATFPLEARYFGTKTALKRNALSLAVAIVSSCLIGEILK